MATIIFSNGQRVNFDGNPTPQDVEEVAIKLGLQSPKTPIVPEVEQPEKKGFFKNLTQTIFGGAANLATRPGQLLGTGVVKAAEAVGLPFSYDKALASLDQPMKSAIGTDVRPISKETPKTLAGEALGTVALGVGSPVIAGGMLGASAGLEKEGSAGEVALDTVIGAVTGKVFEVGFKAASPYIVKVVAKYGTPAVEQLQKALPEYAKPYLDALIKGGKGVIRAEADKASSQTSQKAMEDALGFVKKRNPTKNEIMEAFVEGRTQTVGKKQELITTPQQQRQASALQPLIDSGELKIAKDGLPRPENREVVVQNVERLNQGLKNLVRNPKYNQPFSDRELMTALNAVKKDTEVIFASDPTIEKVYDALIEEAYKAVKTNNVAGVLDARQEFDKIPAVKALLDKLGAGSSGENLKREGVLAVRRSLNNFAADLLDRAQSQSILRSMQPSEAKILIERAKKFSNADDFVKDQLKGYSRSSDPTARFKLQDPKTAPKYKTPGGSPVQRFSREDLKEVWELARIQPNATAGELFTQTLRNEADLLGAIDSMSVNYPELFSEANKTFFQKHPNLKNLLWWSAGIGTASIGIPSVRGIFNE